MKQGEPFDMEELQVKLEITGQLLEMLSEEYLKERPEDVFSPGVMKALGNIGEDGAYELCRQYKYIVCVVEVTKERITEAIKEITNDVNKRKQ
jgi:hypothetical protein